MSKAVCPECSAPLDYDEVDIGVGVQQGNFRCEHCGWYPPDPALGDSLLERELEERFGKEEEKKDGSKT